MKKLLALIMVFVLVSVAAVTPVMGEEDKIADTEREAIQQEITNKLIDMSGDNKEELEILWDEQKPVPRVITGRLSAVPVNSPEAVLAFINENKSMFGVKFGEFVIQSMEQEEETGITHYTMELDADGIPVYNQQIMLHTDKEGVIYAINGEAYAEVPEMAWQGEVKLPPEEAIALAQASLDYTPDEKLETDDPEQEPSVPQAKLYMHQIGDKWQPVYLVRFSFIDPYPADMRIFVNATTGEIVQSTNEIKGFAAKGSGVGMYSGKHELDVDMIFSSLGATYYMRDLTRGARIATFTAQGTSLKNLLVSDRDGSFDSADQAQAVDAHYYMGVIYDYFRKNFNRNSYDNNGAPIVTLVNYSKNYNCAYWNGTRIIVGDGDGMGYKPSCTLDVLAHEYTHAIIDKTCNLNSGGESGALCESLADSFAYLAEGDANDWLIGENCYDNPTNMANPCAYKGVEDIDDFVNNSIMPDRDYINKGIPNKAFYYIASTLGTEKTAKIYYRAMTNYFYPTILFGDAKRLLVEAAKDIYGKGSYEAQAVANGFAMVGIGNPTASYGDNYEPNDYRATAYGYLANGTRHWSFISSSTDVDYYYFKTTAPGSIKVTLEGMLMDYDIYLYDEAGTLLGSSIRASANNEVINYSASASAGKFYVKVVGYRGAWSSLYPYSLRVKYPMSAAQKLWSFESNTIQSPHYPTSPYTGTNTYSKPGASRVMVCFTNLDTMLYHSNVIVKDHNGVIIGKYEGVKGPIWVLADGDTMKITYTNDAMYQSYGYAITKEYYISY